MTAREKFRAEVAEALTSWRLGCITARPDYSRERMVISMGIGEVAALRLTALYLPILHTLGRVQRNVENIAALSSNRDPYAPKNKC